MVPLVMASLPRRCVTVEGNGFIANCDGCTATAVGGNAFNADCLQIVMASFVKSLLRRRGVAREIRNGPIDNIKVGIQ